MIWRLFFRSGMSLVAGSVLAVACTPAGGKRGDSPHATSPDATSPDATNADATTTPVEDAATAFSTPEPPPPAQLDPDGDDDPDPPTPGELAISYRLTKVGRPPLALTRICDMTVLGDRLFLAHANAPLGSDGATLTSYQPSADKPFRVAFDWNRPGEPTRGGGAGQGFVRIRAIDGRLFVADADPPYAGLGVLDHGTEGYVFVSDAHGTFAASRPPHHGLPARPTSGPDGRAGASVVPRAYHDIDVIRFRGRIYVSTGAVPPKEPAWRGPAPGALMVASDELSRFTYEIGFPTPYGDGTWRLTYLVRFKDRLYAGIQDYDARSPWDYVYFSPDPTHTQIEATDAHPTRVTDDGAAQTLRWFADRGRLFWIASARDGVKLRVTTDGDTWAEIPLPPAVGRPTDIRRFKNGIVVLTERALLRLDAAMKVTVLGEVFPAPGNDAESTIKPTKKKTSPFVLDDIFCSAPLRALGGRLYAGGQRDGSLYEWIELDPNATESR